MIVGFIFINVSSLSHKVKPPNNTIIIPVTNGIIGIRRSTIYDTISTITVAIMMAAVAANKSPNQYVIKKTTIGA